MTPTIVPRVRDAGFKCSWKAAYLTKARSHSHSLPELGREVKGSELVSCWNESAVSCGYTWWGRGHRQQKSGEENRCIDGCLVAKYQQFASKYLSISGPFVFFLSWLPSFFSTRGNQPHAEQRKQEQPWEPRHNIQTYKSSWTLEAVLFVRILLCFWVFFVFRNLSSLLSSLQKLYINQLERGGRRWNWIQSLCILPLPELFWVTVLLL